jgi:hypothetical protein
MRGALFAVVLCLGATTAGAAETSAPLPPGLSAVWRIDGRKLEAYASAWSLAAFSTDGSLKTPLAAKRRHLASPTARDPAYFLAPGGWRLECPLGH